jgi:hypothetical protein
MTPKSQTSLQQPRHHRFRNPNMYLPLFDETQAGNMLAFWLKTMVFAGYIVVLMLISCEKLLEPGFTGALYNLSFCFFLDSLDFIIQF